MINDNKKLIKYPGNNDDYLGVLMDYLARLKEEKFTGYIKINFSQGSIGRTERFEEILKRKQ